MATLVRETSLWVNVSTVGISSRLPGCLWCCIFWHSVSFQETHYLAIIWKTTPLPHVVDEIWAGFAVTGINWCWEKACSSYCGLFKNTAKLKWREMENVLLREIKWTALPVKLCVCSKTVHVVYLSVGLPWASLGSCCFLPIRVFPLDICLLIMQSSKRRNNPLNISV